MSIDEVEQQLDEAVEVKPFALNFAGTSDVLDFRPKMVTGDPKAESVAALSVERDTTQPELPLNEEIAVNPVVVTQSPETPATEMQAETPIAKPTAKSITTPNAR